MESKSSTNNLSPAKGTNSRVVIIGAVAGGAAAAARLTRLNNKLDITLIDKAPHVSIASCGMPYYIGREIEEYDSLLIHTPESLQKTIGVSRVLVNTEAIKIDRKRKVVITRNVTHLNCAAASTYSASSSSSAAQLAGNDGCGGTIDDTLVEYPYDFLILSTGASPIVPPIQGLSVPYPSEKSIAAPTASTTTVAGSKAFSPDSFIQSRVLTLRNLTDMNKIAHIVGQKDKPDDANEDLKKMMATATTTTADSSQNANNKVRPTATTPPTPTLSIAVIGAGFIGLEIAEQLHNLGHKVAIVERNPTVLPVCDDEIGAMLHPVIRSKKDVSLITNDSLVKISKRKIVSKTTTTTTATEASPARTDGRYVLALETAKGLQMEADLAILCVGVKADSKLARDCGLKLSSTNPSQNQLITVDNFMRTTDPFIYAVGDAVEVSDGVFRDVKTWTPLATVAVMQSRIVADHIVLGKSIPFRGTFSTAIVRCFDVAIATTGWSEKRLKLNKTPFAVSVINGWSIASYYPGARPVLIKLTYCPTTGRLFGGQCVGSTSAGVDKRIDIVSTALLGNLTIHELSHGQFAYAPPFNSAKDPVTIACLNGRNITFDHLTNGTTRLDPSATVIDVRPKGAFEKDPVTTAVKGQKRTHLFWATSRDGAKNLLAGSSTATSSTAAGPTTTTASSGSSDKEKFQSICFWGRTSYFAHRNILQAGVPASRVTTLQGGNVYAKALKEAELSGSKL